MVKNRIKFLRKSEAFDLTQIELAEKLGVSRQTIIDIETSKRLPSGEIMLKICNFFNKDIREIFFAHHVDSSLHGEKLVKKLYRKSNKCH